MKRRMLAVIVLAMILLSLFPCSVHAEDACGIAGFDDPLICGTPDSDEETELQNRVRNVLNTVYLWIGIIAVIVIVIGGVRYMTSQGEPDKIKGAKNTITYALVGLIVTLAAFAITNLVIGALEGRAPTETAEDGGGSTGGGTTGEDRTAVRAVTMVSSTEVPIGETAKLKAKVVPDYAKDKTLTWSSDNPNVVSVNEGGVIKANKAGTAKITAKSSNGKTATSEVTVLEEIKPESVTVSPSTVTMRKGGKSTIKATISPYNAKNKTLKWSSSNTKIATVSGVGVITAKKAGKVTITVETVNGKKATVKVTVSQSGGDGIETTGSQVNVPLNGKPNIRKATKAIIDDHRMDFYQSSYTTYINRYGGYDKYVNDLGGVFGKYAKTDRIPVKTAADFQVAAEYVYGLMTIWGGDYNGGHNVAWRNNAVWKNGKKDRFRSSFGGKKFGYRNIAIDKRLKVYKETNYVCSTMLGTFISSTGLKYHYLENENSNRKALIRDYPTIRDATKLQVGDVIMFSTGSHVAIVGEVYKDYVVIYDGGSRFTRNGSYKFLLNRKSSQAASLRGSAYSGDHWWVGIRLWNIDQNVTLKGIN